MRWVTTTLTQGAQESRSAAWRRTGAPPSPVTRPTTRGARSGAGGSRCGDRPSTGTPWSGYPNPAQSIIQYPPALDVTVWDAWGREVFHGDLLDGQLHVSGWSVGTYVVRASDGPTSRFVVVD